MTHTFEVTSTWTGNRGEGTSGYRGYDRDVTLDSPGVPPILASADKPFRGDPQRWNPEELLLAALSECHLLSYLHCCVTEGVVVTAYRDTAHAELVTEGNGGRIVSATLRPHVTVAGADQVDAAMAAHEIAHQWCFIANSVNFEVSIEPTVEVASS